MIWTRFFIGWAGIYQAKDVRRAGLHGGALLPGWGGAHRTADLLTPVPCAGTIEKKLMIRG